MAKVPVRVGQVHTMLHWYGKTKLRQTKQIIEETIVHKLFTHKIIFVSENTRNYFYNRTKINSKKLLVIYNGIAFNEYKPTLNKTDLLNILNIPQEKKIIGFIGRLVKGKGMEYLCEFIQSALEVNNNYIFMIVGDGDGQKLLKKRLKQFELENSVYYIGSRKDVGNFYNIFDAFLFTSDENTEGLPGVILEAAFFSLPIIARPINILKEINNFYSGIIFIDDLHQANNVLQKALCMKKINNKKFVNTFSIENMLTITISTYNNLLK
jgi:glycosyltransferase involved in cell wall biosynthesis